MAQPRKIQDQGLPFLVPLNREQFESEYQRLGQEGNLDAQTDLMWAWKQVRDAKPKGVAGALQKALIGAGDTLTFGTLDEIAAATAYLTGDDYDEALDRNRATLDLISGDGSYIAGQIAGAFLAPTTVAGAGYVARGANIGSRATRAGAVAAGEGLGYGFGSGEGGFGERAKKGAVTAAIAAPAGFALGGLAEMAISGGSRVSKGAGKLMAGADEIQGPFAAEVPAQRIHDVTAAQDLGFTLSRAMKTGRQSHFKLETDLIQQFGEGPVREAYMTNYDILAQNVDQIIPGFKNVSQNPNSIFHSTAEALGEAAEGLRADVNRAYQKFGQVEGFFDPKAFRDMPDELAGWLNSNNVAFFDQASSHPQSVSMFNVIRQMSGRDIVPDPRAPREVVDDFLKRRGVWVADEGRGGLPGAFTPDNRIAQEGGAAAAAGKFRGPYRGYRTKELEQQRQRLIGLYQAAEPRSKDQRAAKLILDWFDQHLEDAARAGFWSGDDELIDVLKNARGMNKMMKELLTKRNPKDHGGAIVEELMANLSSPSEMINVLFGANKVGLKKGSTDAVRRIDRLFDEVAEGAYRRFEAGKISREAYEIARRQADQSKLLVRQAAWAKIAMDPQNPGQLLGTTAITRNAADLLHTNRDMAEILFGKEATERLTKIIRAERVLRPVERHVGESTEEGIEDFFMAQMANTLKSYGLPPSPTNPVARAQWMVSKLTWLTGVRKVLEGMNTRAQQRLIGEAAGRPAAGPTVQRLSRAAGAAGRAARGGARRAAVATPLAAAAVAGEDDEPDN